MPSGMTDEVSFLNKLFYDSLHTYFLPAPRPYF